MRQRSKTNRLTNCPTDPYVMGKMLDEAHNFDAAFTEFRQWDADRKLESKGALLKIWTTNLAQTIS